MGKRYVFWRRPDGRSYSGTDGKFALTELLADVGESSSVNEDGNVSWKNVWMVTFKPAFQASVVVTDDLGEELNATDAWNITRDAIVASIHRAGAGKRVSHAEFIRQGDIKAAAYFREPEQQYALITSLSVASMPAKTVRIRGCSVSPLASRARFPFPERLKRQLGGSRYAEHVEESRYQLVRVKTAGRTVYAAAAKATDALTQLCGLWNLFATLGAWSMNFGMSKYSPIGVIHIGPIRTLHTPTGKPAGDVYWYEPGYISDRKLFQPKNGWDRIEKDRRWAMRRLSRLPYRREVEDVIIRYAEALAESNLDVAFLRMWSILEKISHTVELKGYDETVSRIVWPYSDRHVAIEVLNALRQQRNMLVHSARSTEEADQVMYTIKRFVDPHLLRLVRNDFRVNSLEEYGRHLALSTDINQLRRQRQRLNVAIGFLRRAKEPETSK